MSHQTTAWRLSPSASLTPAVPRADASSTPGRLASGVLALASLILLALACASAWLSYHAQVDYVLAHNGDLRAQARVWALLLDTGTAGVSLLRLYETLRGQPDWGTKSSLLGCTTASVTMNLLHTPSHTPGGYLVAAVPPVMYAVFLEHLLTNLRALLMGTEQRRSLWRDLVLWINFPALMWRGRRTSLRRAAHEDLTAVESAPSSRPLRLCSAEGDNEAEQWEGTGSAGRAAVAPLSDSRRGRGPGAKRVAFEAALVEQVKCGDLRLFSRDERERNAAAYQAAASLPVPLSRGAARRYVVQALPRLESSGAVATQAVC
jgi:Protein of unknown function (DUF2637)